ncbi:MAG: FAD-dependent oxidoreductase [Pseudomonadota bacterium]
MARTPLFAQLQRHFRIAAAAEQMGLTPELYLDQRARNPGITRRQAIAGIGAAATMTAMPGWAGKKAPRIAIVGAGMAGLNCALTLHDAGIASTVYEASSRVGGRMFSLEAGQYWAQNQVSEWMGELIDSGHLHMQRLARRFGLPLDDLLAAEPAGSEDSYQFFGRYYRYADARRDFQAIYQSLKAEQRTAPFPSTYDNITPRGIELDAMSIRDYLARTIPGGLQSPLAALLGTAYAPEYAADIEDQSALNLLYLLAFQPDPQGFLVFGESDEQFHIRGGNAQLPRAMAASLPAGSIQFGQKLVKLARSSGGAQQLTFEDGSQTLEITADLVVLALPFATLANVDLRQAGFDELKLKAIREQGRGKSGKTQLQCSSRFWNSTGAWPGISNGASYADTGYQSSWDVTRAQAGGMGILNLFTGGSVTANLRSNKAFGMASNGAVLADVQTLMGRAELVLPGLSSSFTGLATQSLPHLSPYFGLSYSYYRVGQYRQFCGYEGAAQGGVHFCGEHTSINYQGYMEGAAETGASVGKMLAMLAR